MSPRLVDLGVSKADSSRWQRVARSAEKAEQLHGEWLPLLAQVGVSDVAARRLMAVARHPVLADQSNGLMLPAGDVASLYQLSRLPEPELRAAIDAGEVRPDMRSAEKAEQQARAWDLWLDCREQQEIAAEIGVDPATVSRWLQERKSAEMQAPESRQHFDVWSFHTAAGDSSYFGKMPPQGPRQQIGALPRCVLANPCNAKVLPARANATRESHLLPCASETLYELSRLPEPELRAAIDAGEARRAPARVQPLPGTGRAAVSSLGHAWDTRGRETAAIDGK